MVNKETAVEYLLRHFIECYDWTDGSNLWFEDKIKVAKEMEHEQMRKIFKEMFFLAKNQKE